MIDENTRILMINSQSIYKNNATGITARSIVSNIPRRSIMELYRYKSRDSVNFQYDFESVQIPPKSMPVNYFIRKFLKLDNVYDQQNVSGLNYSKNIKYSWKSVISNILKNYCENSFICPERAFLKKIDEFSPTVIYTMGASTFVHNWVLYFAKRYHCPIVIHYMDNWRETTYKQDQRLKPILHLQEKQLRMMEDKMTYGLVISEAMAEYYTKTYGKKFLPLMNTVNDHRCADSQHSELQIVYAGGLHLNRNKSLQDVSSIVEKIDGVKLIVFTSTENMERYQNEFLEFKKTEFRQAVPHSLIHRVYNEADVLLHIESFDPGIQEFTKYSLSTKIPEYMGANKAILCYAPEAIESYQYIKRYNVGLCVSNKNDLTKAILQMLSQNKRDELIQHTKRTVEKNHSIKHMEEVLEQVFCERVTNEK